MESLAPRNDASHRPMPAALIFIDVDHFKAFNDSLGHLAGDHALRVVAEVIEQCAPRDAIVARYGGEEFACLLFNVDRPRVPWPSPNASEPASGDAPCRRRDNRPAMSPSAQAWPGDDSLATTTPQALLSEADAAQYEAKRAGRDCVRGAERAT